MVVLLILGGAGFAMVVVCGSNGGFDLLGWVVGGGGDGGGL